MTGAPCGAPCHFTFRDLRAENETYSCRALCDLPAGHPGEHSHPAARGQKHTWRSCGVVCSGRVRWVCEKEPGHEGLHAWGGHGWYDTAAAPVKPIARLVKDAEYIARIVEKRPADARAMLLDFCAELRRHDKPT